MIHFLILEFNRLNLFNSTFKIKFYRTGRADIFHTDEIQWSLKCVGCRVLQMIGDGWIALECKGEDVVEKGIFAMWVPACVALVMTQNAMLMLHPSERLRTIPSLNILLETPELLYRNEPEKRYTTKSYGLCLVRGAKIFLEFRLVVLKVFNTNNILFTLFDGPL